MASSYSYVARQANKGNEANRQFQTMKENGLNIANTMIKSSDNLDFVWNKYGFKGREWDDVLNDFAPEQLGMTNNLLAFTKDAWEHTLLWSSIFVTLRPDFCHVVYATP